MEDDRTRVNSVLSRSGGVIWVEPVQYVIHCKTDTTNWPHDTQTGVLKLGSWLYLGRDLNLTIDEGGEVGDTHLTMPIPTYIVHKWRPDFVCNPDQKVMGGGRDFL